ncbi:MAG: hypothetical protein WA708_18170 [Acidobacteriaceae bacterium]
MYIKILQGRDAGKVRDIANEAAMGLLKDGRAERAFQEPPRVKTASAPVEEKPVKSTKKRKAAK